MAVPDIERAIRDVFARWRRGGHEATCERLRGEARARGWEAEFEPRGDEIAVFVVVTEGDAAPRMHRFVLRDSAVRDEPGPAAREVAGRREQEDLLIRGIADALELGHSLKSARARLKEKAGPDNLLYDAIELGCRTFRELLELHTRANRGLLGALRRLVPTGSARLEGEARLARTADRKEYCCELTLLSRRERELRAELPRGLYLCGGDGGSRWIDLRCDPSALTLLRDERRTVRMLTDAAPIDALAAGTYCGELVLGVDVGEFASVPLTVELAPGRTDR